MFVDVPGKLPYLRRHYESFNSSIGVEGLQPPVAPPSNRHIDPRSAPAHRDEIVHDPVADDDAR
jgi:hypothetical protein